MGIARDCELMLVRELFPEALLHRRGFPSRWYRGVSIRNTLDEMLPELDVLHVHGLWEQTTLASWRAAGAARVPMLLTPHGALANTWRYESLHKRAYIAAVLRPMLRDVAVVQALNATEEAALRSFGVTGRIRVIPNGLPLQDYQVRHDTELARQRWPELTHRRVMLYLGRLWGGKGLDVLPQAWAETLRLEPSASDWVLVLAGPDHRGYRRTLEGHLDELGLGGRVLLTGELGGSLKASLLFHAECFVLPSHGEGFSMSILEAMAAACPVIYTAECNFPELEAAGGGWEVPRAEAGALTQVLRHVVRQDQSSLRATGAKANALGESRYTLEGVVAQLLGMYHDALDG